ncbi:MAG: 23S rRNA (uracil(1939)-C(5))-methyltransferase RlmD [Candidatus Eisenbacteria bacterium]|uniref:23S rRNA (Uracil(1939)-C(5))-methyltransferase RlmD n=1 Tax=Eiseniibacteriota bacterium TaxID=2212470 RepID=A0A9D6L886_UNCEI|nr:23S rRNA (uracil(1939)-C(5))-methyltransferase RlmD [Candidatus Eisenbacteria bacterium]MBI3538735.1 23S rRNA (uracil(1939)-C(5))-methyltransferase RlmD [Candidatus Eisenbacteria bacterium]
MKVNDLLSLTVTDVALGGKALARSEGRVVFIDRGLPGDEVEARVTRIRRNFAEAGLGAVVRGSPARVEPPCPHVAICGGCRFQDLAYDAQLELKQRQVAETLAHLGGVAAPPVRTITPSPDRFHYRNKMEFSFHPGAGDGPVLGLHARNAFDRVFALETCFLPSELTIEIVRRTAQVARARRWSAYDPRRHDGIVRHLAVRHLPTTGACAVHLVASSDAIPGLDAWAEEIASLSGDIQAVTLLLNRSRANIAFGEEERVLRGGRVIVERLLGLEFEVTANAFLQTNSRQAEALYAAALEAAEIAAGETVLDLYCGTGTLTLLFARAARGGEVVGVESVDDAIERARRNAERNGIAGVRFVAGEARRVLREWARGERPGAVRPAVVVVDPPRAGLHPRVVARVAELAPRRVVYVSCNPATLARDAKDFAALGYALDDVRPFDMFPHTPHIECVARLERRL